MNPVPIPALAAPWYLAAASHAPLTACAEEGLRAFRRSYSTECPWDVWAGELEALRAASATLLGGDPDEIALPSSSSAGVASFLSGLDLCDRPILIAGDAFPGMEQVCRARMGGAGRCVLVPFSQVEARTLREK